MVQKIRQKLLMSGGIAVPGRNNDDTGRPIIDGVSAVTVTEKIRQVRHSIFKLNALSVTVLAANDYGSAKISDLPDTNMLVLGAECDLVVTKGGVTSGLVAATDIICGIGTTATADTTIGTTDQNIIAATTLSTNALALDLDVHNLAASAALVGILDGPSNALYFNVAATGSDPSADDSVSVTGTLDLYWIDLGNVTS